MANKKYPKIKPITIAVQKHKMRVLFKEIIIKDFRGTGLKMILRVQPTQYSKSYRVLIEYSSLQTKPKVYISEEELMLMIWKIFLIRMELKKKEE